MHVTIVRAWEAMSASTRRGVFAGGELRAAFVREVCARLCESGRGDVFCERLKGNVEGVLPSFFDVLRVAVQAEGGSGEDVAGYVHVMERNNLRWKMEWELGVGGGS